jgi:hypothetical protein
MTAESRERPAAGDDRRPLGVRAPEQPGAGLSRRAYISDAPQGECSERVADDDESVDSGKKFKMVASVAA